MMEMYTTRTVDFRHRDERGSLTQIVHDGYRQINVLDTKAGSMRGAHFHKRSVEAFYVVSGSVQVEFKRGGEEKKVNFSEGAFFEIYPHVLHNMYFPEACLMVQMYDVPVENEDGTKDIYTEEEFNA